MSIPNIHTVPVHTRRTINIDSQDRSTGSNYDFTLRLPIRSIGQHGDSYFSIVHVQFMNSCYPINEYYNRVYVSENGGSIVEVVLINGNYTSTDFATMLQNELNASALTLTYTVVENTSTSTYSITCTAANTFRFHPGDRAAYPRMGFSETAVENMVSALTQTSDGIYDLSGPRYVDMLTNLPTENLSTSAYKPYYRIYLNRPFGEEIIHKPSQHLLRHHHELNFNQLEVRLLDDRGNPFVLSPTTNVSIQMEMAMGEHFVT